MNASSPPPRKVHFAGVGTIAIGVRCLPRWMGVVLRRLRGTRNTVRFERLYLHGDLSAYDGDHSRADLALLRQLRLHSHDAAQLERLFQTSALYLYRADRWQQRATGGLTYAQATIRKVLAHDHLTARQ